ncbi:2-amino-4-hydroxy-6-hydroxymethyldihydropteridine diphosphokinase [Biformimicrobium ophioploci]|uniref:2-amino-4-hydroxy-6-hydroxymethyldihydropteridine diphosphokinase n=1 Tax=Biformimicrobium ophioploci TaxID=3036711 RepID=A0ABQ6LUI8_9GAMM|nr:2-amino-4-hydroxy-6-hydroxymethyldihydropteridine diphosphokinase [Microbulbifer sp. NKW57]GMG85740.1 2-amino-4-hydroxy-6-hydroxymethyldihydropteridine diphosphokinase [Microbulbifer sp. NKW57]
MAQVYLSLGSNIEREQHICAALDALAQAFGALQVSSVYESEAVGFEGENFYNLVVGIHTGLSVTELSAVLKQIEDDNGRCRNGPKFSARTLDIDILTYDDLVGEHGGVQLPRDEITRNAFVLWPLAEIAPDARHPQTGERYASLWDAYDKSKQKLWAVEFSWSPPN